MIIDVFVNFFLKNSLKKLNYNPGPQIFDLTVSLNINNFSGVLTSKSENNFKVDTLALRPFPLGAWKRLFFVCFIDFFALLALASILSPERSIKETKNALFHARSGKKYSLFVLLLFFCARFNFNRSLQSKINKRDKECSFPRS